MGLKQWIAYVNFFDTNKDKNIDINEYMNKSVKKTDQERKSFLKLILDWDLNRNKKIDAKELDIATTIEQQIDKDKGKKPEYKNTLLFVLCDLFRLEYVKKFRNYIIRTYGKEYAK